MKALFFDQPDSSCSAVIDSVFKVLPYYQYNQAEEGKSGHSKDIIFSGNNKTLRLSFSFYKGRIYLVSLTGEFDDLFSLYIHYLNANSSREELLRGKCAPVFLHKLPDNRILPISFCKTGKNTWTLYDSIPH